MSTPEEPSDTGDFERRARADLRELVDGTSAELRARISRVTNEALERAARPRRLASRLWVPVASAAAIAVVALLLVPQRDARLDTPGDALVPDDMALLMNVENLDLLEQMEFYQWLDRNPGELDRAEASQGALPRRT